MSGWFWSSGFGPGPLVGTGPDTPRNGLAGPTINPKKKAATQNITTVAHATTGSSRRCRNLCPTAAMYRVSTMVHRRIEPSGAAHSDANVYRSGVGRDPLLAT